MNEAQSFETSVDKLVSAGRSLWLAGLGAVAGVEKGGRDLFDRLVERGRPVEKRQRKTLEKVGERTQETVRELRKLVEDTMEYETKGVLKRLGLLTSDDVKVLAARLDTLAKRIDEISARQETPVADAADTAATSPATAASSKERRPRQRKS